MNAWQTNLITKDADILALARSSHRIAVLGIRSSDGKSISAKVIIAGKGEHAAPQPQPKLPTGQRG